MPHQRDWIDYLVAFAPLLAIGVAIGLATMQAYLQRQQLKQNLFDRRFTVYEETLTYLVTMLQLDGETDLEHYKAFGKPQTPARCYSVQRCSASLNP
jgi:hypothetical protein